MKRVFKLKYAIPIFLLAISSYTTSMVSCTSAQQKETEIEIADAKIKYKWLDAETNKALIKLEKELNIQTAYSMDNKVYKKNMEGSLNNDQRPNKLVIHSTATAIYYAKDWVERSNSGQMNNSACAHYFIDNKDIYNVLPDWHTGYHTGKNNESNKNSIGIEMAEPFYDNEVWKGKKKPSAEAIAYAKSVYENKLVPLCAYYCIKHGIVVSNVKTHYQWGECQQKVDKNK